MKIDGLNSFLNNQIQVIDELNLKEGQKFLGKIARFANDEVLLEIAGRPLTARVQEHTSLTPGTTRMFQVTNSSQGQIVLKVLPNVNSTTPNAELKGDAQTASSEETVLKLNLDTSIDAQTQRRIVASLKQENLPVTSENIAKIYKFMQDFQARYLLNLSPKVFAFLISQKMPVTPGTILASWVFQDKGARNLLWNILRKSLPEKSQLELFSKFVLEPKETPAIIQQKLHDINNLRIGEFLEKLIELDLKNNTTNRSPDNIQKETTTKLQNFVKEDFVFNKQDLESLLAKNDTNIINGKKIFHDEIKQMPDARDGKEAAKTVLTFEDKPGKVMDINQSPYEIKGNALSNKESGNENIVQNKQTDSISGKLDGENQQKVKTILEQNLELNKALTNDKSTTMASCVIPFLIRDSHNELHECLVKWEEEKSGENGELSGEYLQLDVPTENLGEIHLAVRIDQAGVRINLKVASEEIRKYLQKHTVNLKESLPEAAVVAISLKNTETSGSDLSGVDLWM